MELSCEGGDEPTFIMGNHFVFCQIRSWETFFLEAFLKKLQHIQLTLSVHLTFTYVHALKKAYQHFITIANRDYA